MKNIKIIDGHCDTLTHILDRNCNLEDESNHLSIDKLKSGNVYIQFFAAWIGSKNEHRPSLQRSLRLIDRFYSMLIEHPGTFHPIYDSKDIENIKEGQIGALLTIEGGEALEGELSNLRMVHRLGVRLITLTWNHANEISGGIMDEKGPYGLSEFGKSVVEEMNRLNMMIDVSHISVPGFWDVVKYTEKPIIASHSNAKSLCPHPRNLDDNQILAISKTNGIIGLNFYSPFLAEGTSDLDDIIRHIDYIAGLGGINIIGFGSDFDGIDQLPQNISGPQDYPKIINRLLQLNYSEDDVKKISADNFLRVIKTTCG